MFKQKFNDTSLSLDDYISFKANEQNLKLYGLETIEEQIEIINKDVEGMPLRTHKRRLQRLSNIIDKIELITQFTVKKLIGILKWK